ncbi:MAG: YbaY family lipoprotein [Betaproteobacteria bacterium]|nr:YbaY family lipoprotein [Betaproteobacteria bacterium]
MKRTSPMKSLSVTLASALAVVMVPGCATVEPTPAPAPAAGKAEPAAKVIRGSIVYREKVALPPDAELVVQLLDVTKPDKPVVNAEATIRTDGGQVPIGSRCLSTRRSSPGASTACARASASAERRSS